MGQVFSNLTNQGASTGGQFYADPGAAGQAMAQQAAKTAQPDVANLSGDLNSSGYHFDPQSSAQPSMQMVKPSFLQAANMRDPNTGAPESPLFNPTLSKGGKLLSMLGLGLQGALAGRAAQEQMIAQSGGRRSGGVGVGFMGGLNLPFTRAQQGQELERGQAQTELLKAQSNMIPTPYGMMPASLARFILPASIRGGAEVTSAGIKGKSQEAAAQTGAQAKVQAATIASRFKAVPGVGLFDSQAGTVIPGTQQGVTVTPELAQDYGLPQDFIGKPMTIANLSSLERAAAALAPSTTTSVSPEGLTTTSTRTKQLPFVPKTAGQGRQTRLIASSSTAAPQSVAGNKPLPAALESQAQGLVSGDIAPSQLSKRSASYNMILSRANAISQQKNGKPFDSGQSQIDYQYAQNPQTQNVLKYLNSLTGSNGGKGNLDTLVDLSNKLDRGQYPPLNDVAMWAKLQSGNPQIAAYHAAATEVADQVAKILQGGGTGNGTSDAKMKQGLDMFRSGFTKDQIQSTATTLRDLLANRKRELIGDNRYLIKQYGAPNKKSSGAVSNLSPAGQAYLQSIGVQ